VLGDALRRFGGVEHDVEVQAIDPALAPGVSADGTGWRTRVRLQVAEDGAVGPYAARSHTVVPVASVPLAVAALAELAPLSSRFPGARAVDLVAPSVGEPALVVVDAERMPRRDPRPTITERVGDRTFRLDRDGFWQVHRGAAATLTRAVQDAVDPACSTRGRRTSTSTAGSGCSPRPWATASATRCASPRSRPTPGPPSTPTPTSPNGSARERSPRASTASSTISRMPRRPTSGHGSATRPSCSTRRARAQGAPSSTGSPSCARASSCTWPATPSRSPRDVGLLRERGYALDELVAFDLFPNTHHVEAVARLTAIV
jgi:tRNA/tmRNA/rRNA uracil-C5-methylase (TrmA/RlmC/RlmD family)